MSVHACITAVNDAAGRELTDEELDRVFTLMQNRMKRLRGEGMSARQAAERAGQEIGGEIRAAAILEKRNAALNILRRQELDARVRPGHEYKDVQAVLTGSERGSPRGGDSIDAAQLTLRDQMNGAVIHDLQQEGVLKAALTRNRDFDRDVARELWRMGDPAAKPSGNAPAMAVAKVMHRYQETLRGMLNEAGAWIGKVDHYVTRQSHDMFKVRGDGSDAAFQAWRDFIAPRLDARTFDVVDDTPAARAELLRNVWQNLASGIHDRTTSETLAGFTGPGNLAKRLSSERVLHFKDADSWFDYNARYGKGSVIDAFAASIEKGTRDLALMRVLGTNPEALYRAWVDKLAEKAADRHDFKAADKLRKDNFNDRVLDVLTGKASIPADQTLALVGGYVRAGEQLARLGNVALSSLPDLAVNAGMLRHNGIGIFEAYAREMVDLLPRDETKQEIAELLGVGIDHLVGGVMRRFQSDDGIPGKMAAAVQSFHKWNGLIYWTDSLKAASGLMLSHNLARRAGQAFETLPARMQKTLERYGIDAADWAKLPQHVQRAADKRDYVLPAHMDDAELARKFSTYIIDQTREGMTEPTAWGRAFVAMGTQRGTYAGEFVRLLNQFRLYTVTFMERSLGRELFRSGVDVGGLAHLIVATTALGYLSMTLKEFAKGRNPRDPQKPADYANLVAAAMAQGGGLGIYGDFLFGDSNRLGGGFASTIAGPFLGGTVDDVRKVLLAIRTGEHPAAVAMQSAKNNAPFLNLFYTRAALDYLVLYRMQEWANPGYLRRYEANVRRDNNQTFWLRPTEAIR